MRSEKVILEERAGIINQVRDKWADVRKENRSPNDDELTFFDNADKDITKLTTEADEVRKAKGYEDRANGYESLLSDKPAERSVLPENAKAPTKEQHRAAFRKWTMYGDAGINAEERSILNSYAKRGTSTQVSSTTTLGGFAMPEDWVAELEKKMAWYGGALDACGIKYRSSGGGDMHVTTVDDTAQKGAIITQGTGDVVNDLTFAEILLKAYSYTSKMLKFSWESFDDLSFDPANEAQDISAERIGRILNEHFTTGDNSTKPQGLVNGSTLGKTAAGASAITRDEIVDLVHSVDRAYRFGPRVAFMFADSTLAYIKKLAFGSSDDRPLWQPSIREGEPDRLEGFKYFVNNDMAAIATGNKTVLFGDFSKYVIRQTGDYIFSKSTERYFEERAVAFALFCRFDGRYVQTAAVKHLIQA